MSKTPFYIAVGIIAVLWLALGCQEKRATAVTQPAQPVVYALPSFHIVGYGAAGTHANQVEILHDDERHVTCYGATNGLGGFEGGLSCVKDNGYERSPHEQ